MKKDGSSLQNLGTMYPVNSTHMKGLAIKKSSLTQTGKLEIAGLNESCWCFSSENNPLIHNVSTLFMAIYLLHVIYELPKL